MDGGRVLRALLAMRLDYVRATRTAAKIGQFMAIVFGLIGLLGNPFLLVIALFVWVGAAARPARSSFARAWPGCRSNEPWSATSRPSRPTTRSPPPRARVLDGFQHDFPVVENGKTVGVLPRDALLAALTQAGPEGHVADFMRKDFQTADPRDMVEPVFQRLKEGGCPVMPIVRDGALVGLLTPDNVFELVMIREAVRGREVPTLPTVAEHPA